MTQIGTSEPVGSQPAADDAAAEEFSAALQSAFPPLDAPFNPVPVEPPPVDGALRAVVPPPVLVSSDELAEQLRYQRILFKRGPASVPVEALVAIGGALAIHAVLIVLFWFGLFVAFTAAGKGSAAWSPEADSGGAGGYMIMGTGTQGDPNLGGDVRDLLVKAAGSVAPAPPVPDIAKPDPLRELAQSELASAPSETDVIGLSHGTMDLGTIKVRSQPPPVTTVDVNNIAAPIPPAASVKSRDADPNAAASVTGQTGPRAGAHTPGPGLGGDDENEPVIDIMKPGTGGSGNGSGHHAGDGIDRGASGANNENPQVLDAPPLEVPIAARLKPPQHKAIFEVTVLTDGRPGKIELTESCGQQEIDELCQATVAKYHFRPAYLAGRPIAKSMTVSFSFGEDQ